MPSHYPISEIDPVKGQLLFRGADAAILASKESFESVLHLLIHGRLPTKEQLSTLMSSMSNYRSHGPNVLDTQPSESKSNEESPLIVLASQLDDYADRWGFDTAGSLLFFVTLTPMVIASQWRSAHGEGIISSRNDLGQAANLLRMLGNQTNQDLVRDFQTCLILHMDDPQNPSLNALEEKMKSGASPSESLIAALNEHSKPLHHGAGWEAFKTISAIHDPSGVPEILGERMDRGDRIFGLGHRIYRTIDPRAVVLREILRRRTAGTPQESLFQVVEAMATEGSRLIMERKGLTVYPNVDLYNAAVYSVLGVPAELNTQMFAVSRVCGWTAHILELRNIPGLETTKGTY
jgi:citrate synthase